MSDGLVSDTSQEVIVPIAGELRQPTKSGILARHAAYWACAFVLLQIACQVGLLFQTLGVLRVFMRSAAFGTSMVFLVLLGGNARKHPARAWVIVALAIVWLGLLHPTTNSLLAGTAHATLYLAVMAPIFWACRLSLTAAGLRRVLLFMWVFHALSAGVGVLQMHYPGQFQPRISLAIEVMGDKAGALKMRLANGQEVWRPMGLTDTPGGAASSGLFAVVCGLGFFLSSHSAPQRLLSVAGLAVGSFCLYIGQIRSLVVMAGVSCLALVGILIWRGESRRLMGATLVVPTVVIAAFLWASGVGGQSTVDRLYTLVESDPGKVYGENRGHFLAYTFTDVLPEYPLGAGLGRWGMMRPYFGDERNESSPPIWVEIQWTGWLLDGGVPLMIVYVVAVLITCRQSLRVALSRMPGDMPLWGALVSALNLGTLAVTFNYPVFIGGGGMDFWFLNGCLMAAFWTTQLSLRPAA